MHYAQAVAIKPDYVDAEGNWASAFVQSRRARGSDSTFRARLAAQAQFVRVAQQFGHRVAQRRNVASSGRSISASDKTKKRKPCRPFQSWPRLEGRSTPGSGRSLRASIGAGAPIIFSIYAELLSAYEKLNQSKKAIAIVEKGLELARSTGQKASAQQFEDWLENIAQQARRSVQSVSKLRHRSHHTLAFPRDAFDGTSFLGVDIRNYLCSDGDGLPAPAADDDPDVELALEDRWLTRFPIAVPGQRVLEHVPVLSLS